MYYPHILLHSSHIAKELNNLIFRHLENGAIVFKARSHIGTELNYPVVIRLDNVQMS